jgi:lysyl-tRNA synthetase class II
MGICKNEGTFLPELSCFVEANNKEQKLYCNKLRDKLKNEKPVKFRIKQSRRLQFKISFKLLNGKTYKIQDIFDDSDEALNDSYEKIHTLLYGGDILTIFFISTDQSINYELYCDKDSIFKNIEEKINQKFAEYRNKKKIYLYDGNMIDINKTFGENKIKDNSLILVTTNDNPSVNVISSTYLI